MKSTSVGLELSDEKNAVAIVTYANEPEDMERLIKALESISRKERKNFENPGQTKASRFASICHEPKTGIFLRKKSDFVERCSGRNRRGGAATLYPTGHSHPNPGERVTEEIWNYMEEYRRKGLHFHGPADERLETFQIIMFKKNKKYGTMITKV